jgi:hypothetical protein
MNLEYNVTTTVEMFKSQQIEDENFITVEHRENGITMWTAFIGKGENNNQKKSIKLSLSGGVFEIKRMAGNALLNAEALLKKESFNKVISNESFKNLYKKEKERYAVEL